jgi:hypothetical protein
MEIPMTSIEEQYAQGPQPEVTDMQIPQPGQLSEEEVANIMAQIEDRLPNMRLQGEYDRLVIEQFTTDALLNRRPINSIPGLLGLELKVRELKAQQYLADYTANLSGHIQEQLQKDAEQKVISLKSGIVNTLLFNGDNAGEVVAFTKGEPLEDAQKLILDESNTEKRITFQTPDANYKSGHREISLVPGLYIVKCGDGSTWSMTQTELDTTKATIQN